MSDRFIGKFGGGGESLDYGGVLLIGVFGHYKDEDEDEFKDEYNIIYYVVFILIYINI